MRAAIPELDPTAVYEVAVEDGHFSSVTPVAERDPDDAVTPELWPGFTEAHAHLALPANFDDSLDDPRISAMQYLYHGVTHVVDMFGFPLVKDGWEQGRQESALPWPEVAHCGYAATATKDTDGHYGHGVEFPAPVFMLGVQDDLATVLAANAARGATFLKVMFTEGAEQPESAKRFSRLPGEILAHVPRLAAEHGLRTVIDCNTRDEVMQAYDFGFRIFAHPVRDVGLSAADWQKLAGARFVSTLSGLRPMIMEREDFLREYRRPGFRETQDLANLEYVSAIEEPFGIQFKVQDTRTAALVNMRDNSLAALERGALLIGTDCGNTGAFHGDALKGELDLLAGDDLGKPGLRDALLRTATTTARGFFDELSGREPGTDLIAQGRPATFNLIAPAAAGRPLSELPQATYIRGRALDRAAVVTAIRDLRATPTQGKVTV
ncbi:hydrolase [Streptomyces sp. RKAG290]|uniref:hydrolase n=1 Tax=Streptomyces sp. RKAG290 TaxID=2888348 RepID=UPI0020345E20|nr:hydrolase [Streptomyces sp. RKAG290]MCM2413782.1 hydrolase [Streptomyces sp. RKAG290]